MAEEPQVDSLSLLLIERDGALRGYRLDLLKESIPSYFKGFVICSRCKGVMREACGAGDPQEFMCVACAGGDAWISLTQNREVIISLAILCPLKSRGCDWEGKLSSAHSHLDTCHHFNIECPLSCGAVLKRMDMKPHLSKECEFREAECEYCGDNIKSSEYRRHLLTDCVSFPVQCENCCGAEVERQDMQFHTMDVCPNTVLECEYGKHGCGAVVERKNIESHNNDNRLSHMELLMQSGFNSLNEELDRVNQENRMIKLQLSSLVEEKFADQQTLIALADGFASLCCELNALSKKSVNEYHSLQVYKNELVRNVVGPTMVRVDKLEEKNKEIITEVGTKAEIDAVGRLSQRCRDLDYLSLFQFKRRFLITRVLEPCVSTISESWEETKNLPARIIRLDGEIVKGVEVFRITGVFGVKLQCKAAIRICVVLMNQTQTVIQSVHEFRTVTNREEMGSARDIRESNMMKRCRITLQLVDIPMGELLSREVCVQGCVSIQVYFDCDITI